MEHPTPHPIVILSDLHVAHPASLVRNPSQIESLIPENGTVIFNGDSVEMRSHLDRDKGAANRDRLAALATAKNSKAIFLTGNHDPYVSDHHHIELAGGAILVSHGDILFHAVSPWSHESALIAREHTRLLAELPPEQHENLDVRLAVVKQASRILEKFYTSRQSILSVLRNIILEFIPPWRPLLVLHYWREAPGRAHAVAATFRPAARFFIIGHLHHHGIWQSDGRTVINTGCFFPFVGRLMVRIDDRQLDVIRIERRGRSFHPGRIVRSFALEHPAA